MIGILDFIDLCDDGKHKSRAGVEGVMIHMFGVPGISGACGVAEFYRENPEWTGGQMPYTYVCTESGGIEQALEVYEVGPHARRWSSPMIGIACIGNFNLRAPDYAQWGAAVWLASELTVALGIDVFSDTVVGHTEMPGATKTPGKICPGKLWDMGKFRLDVNDHRENSAIQRIENHKILGA